MQEDSFSPLRRYCGELADLKSALALLEWDQQVYQPASGGADRAGQISVLSKLIHEKITSDRLDDLLEKATRHGDPEAGSDDDALLKQLRRERERQRRIPVEFVGDFARVCAVAFGAWEKAREANSFAVLRDDLNQVFELRRTYTGFFSEFANPYDALLDEFEPGMTTAEVQRIFDILRPAQVELVREIGEKHAGAPHLPGPFPIEAQERLARVAAETLGFDFARGRLDRSEHPFTTTFSLNDIRITTRFDENHLEDSLYSVIHETGHALYEQNIDQAYNRLPLGCVQSLAMHESQSRLWENIVGRSADFLFGFYPVIQSFFPSLSKHVTLAEFTRAVNVVRPSLIRTEADEATYNLHIMLRMELEQDLIAGRVRADDLPELWRVKMLDYLGVAPENDCDGVLQDVHWPSGAVGYFPTYALGNVIASQIWDAAIRELPDMSEMLRSGRLAELRQFLTSKIYRYGAKFRCAELVRATTGSEIDPTPYLRYLRHKYLGEKNQ